MYSKGDTRSLFDAMQSFLKVAGEPKPLENKDARVCVS